MKKGFKGLVLIISAALALMVFITGCSNTYQGMKRDLRLDTNSDYDSDKKVTIINRTQIVSPSSSTPTSLPPLQTPPQ